VPDRAKFSPLYLVIYGHVVNFNQTKKKENSVSFDPNQKQFGSFVQLCKRRIFTKGIRKRGEIGP
jgi:hypothetical protein